MNISKKRLIHDMEIINKTPIEGTLVNWTEDNLYEPVAIIIGPKNTPYENGFYCIKFKFTEKFPFEPPIAKFMTTDGKVRMNPNLYANGKICLSLLGTWSGPQWTSCQNLSTILLSIMTILHENPIHNEPGYQTTKITSKRNRLYNTMITHGNIRVGVLQMIINTPTNFTCFKKKIQQYFLENYDCYEKICNDNIDTEFIGKQKAPIYTWYETIDFKLLLIKLQQLKTDLS
tara:strand:- start:700 stop:1392 length:693 start_codon:yes stop_codon:yes gene_type:complete